MKKLILLLALAVFGTVSAQFSMADAENTADLIRKVTALNTHSDRPTKYQNQTDLFAPTNPTIDQNQPMSPSTNSTTSEDQKN